jgi:membrane protease YdiL (CAAX protease family)
MLVLLLGYLLGGIILLVEGGPWEAFRQVVVNGALVVAWLAVAHRLLRQQPAHPLPPLRRPRLELTWALAVLALTLAVVTNAYGQWLPLPRRSHVLVIYLGAALLFLGLRYPPSTWGLRWPSRRGWLALGAVILLNVAAGIVRGLLLPPGEQQGTIGVDLTEQLVTAAAILSLLVSLLLGAALPEELLLRVLLQPRLAHFTGLSWAIFLQAFLFSLVHVPQKLLGNELPLSEAVAYTLLLDNGLIAGYLWHKERSLLLLVLLHLFAFTRLG